MSKELTIIVPVYNTQQYIDRCIQSIISQTISSEIQVIFVDDGSTDNSGKICDNYSEKYPELFSVVHKKNAGLGMARNTGLDHASTKYVTFLDSDDFVKKDFYEQMLRTIQKLKVQACVSGRFISYNSKSSKIAYSVDPSFIGKRFSDKKDIRQLAYKILGPDKEGKDYFCGSVDFTVYDLSFLRLNKLQFVSERSFLSEDFEFSKRFYAVCESVYVSEVCGYHYCYNENSLSRSYMPQRFDLLLQTVESLIKTSPQEQIDRIGIYFWNNYKKCLNQEVRYFPNRKTNDTALIIKKMNENTSVSELIGILNSDKVVDGTNRILVKMLLKKRYKQIVFFLKIYNLYQHSG